MKYLFGFATGIALYFIVLATGVLQQGTPESMIVAMLCGVVGMVFTLRFYP